MLDERLLDDCVETLQTAAQRLAIMSNADRATITALYRLARQRSSAAKQRQEQQAAGGGGDARKVWNPVNPESNGIDNDPDAISYVTIPANVLYLPSVASIAYDSVRVVAHARHVLKSQDQRRRIANKIAARQTRAKMKNRGTSVKRQTRKAMARGTGSSSDTDDEEQEELLLELDEDAKQRRKKLHERNCLPIANPSIHEYDANMCLRAKVLFSSPSADPCDPFHLPQQRQDQLLKLLRSVGTLNHWLLTGQGPLPDTAAASKKRGGFQQNVVGSPLLAVSNRPSMLDDPDLDRSSEDEEHERAFWRRVDHGKEVKIMGVAARALLNDTPGTTNSGCLAGCTSGDTTAAQKQAVANTTLQTRSLETPRPQAGEELKSPRSFVNASDASPMKEPPSQNNGTQQQFSSAPGGKRSVAASQNPLATLLMPVLLQSKNTYDDEHGLFGTDTEKYDTTCSPYGSDALAAFIADLGLLQQHINEDSTTRKTNGAANKFSLDVDDHELRSYCLKVEAEREKLLPSSILDEDDTDASFTANSDMYPSDEVLRSYGVQLEWMRLDDIDRNIEAAYGRNTTGSVPTDVGHPAAEVIENIRKAKAGGGKKEVEVEEEKAADVEMKREYTPEKNERGELQDQENDGDSPPALPRSGTWLGNNRRKVSIAPTPDDMNMNNTPLDGSPLLTANASDNDDDGTSRGDEEKLSHKKSEGNSLDPANTETATGPIEIVYEQEPVPRLDPNAVASTAPADDDEVQERKPFKKMKALPPPANNRSQQPMEDNQQKAATELPPAATAVPRDTSPPTPPTPTTTTTPPSTGRRTVTMRDDEDEMSEGLDSDDTDTMSGDDVSSGDDGIDDDDDVPVAPMPTKLAPRPRDVVCSNASPTEKNASNSFNTAGSRPLADSTSSPKSKKSKKARASSAAEDDSSSVDVRLLTQWGRSLTTFFAISERICATSEIEEKLLEKKNKKKQLQQQQAGNTRTNEDSMVSASGTGADVSASVLTPPPADLSATTAPSGGGGGPDGLDLSPQQAKPMPKNKRLATIRKVEEVDRYTITIEQQEDWFNNIVRGWREVTALSRNRGGSTSSFSPSPSRGDHSVLTDNGGASKRKKKLPLHTDPRKKAPPPKFSLSPSPQQASAVGTSSSSTHKKRLFISPLSPTRPDTTTAGFATSEEQNEPALQRKMVKGAAPAPQPQPSLSSTAWARERERLSQQNADLIKKEEVQAMAIEDKRREVDSLKKLVEDMKCENSEAERRYEEQQRQNQELQDRLARLEDQMVKEQQERAAQVEEAGVRQQAPHEERHHEEDEQKEDVPRQPPAIEGLHTSRELFKKDISSVDTEQNTAGLDGDGDANDEMALSGTTSKPTKVAFHRKKQPASKPPTPEPEETHSRVDEEEPQRVSLAHVAKEHGVAIEEVVEMNEGDNGVVLDPTAPLPPNTVVRLPVSSAAAAVVQEMEEKDNVVNQQVEQHHDESTYGTLVPPSSDTISSSVGGGGGSSPLPPAPADVPPSPSPIKPELEPVREEEKEQPPPQAVYDAPTFRKTPSKKPVEQEPEKEEEQPTVAFEPASEETRVEPADEPQMTKTLTPRKPRDSTPQSSEKKKSVSPARRKHRAALQHASMDNTIAAAGAAESSHFDADPASQQLIDDVRTFRRDASGKNGQPPMWATRLNLSKLAPNMSPVELTELVDELMRIPNVGSNNTTSGGASSPPMRGASPSAHLMINKSLVQIDLLRCPKLSTRQAADDLIRLANAADSLRHFIFNENHFTAAAHNNSASRGGASSSSSAIREATDIVDDLFAVMDEKLARRAVAKVVKSIKEGAIANVDLKNKGLNDQLALDVMFAIVNRKDSATSMQQGGTGSLAGKHASLVRSVDLTGNPGIGSRTAQFLIDTLLRGHCPPGATNNDFKSPVVSLTFGLPSGGGGSIGDGEEDSLPTEILAEAAQLSAARKRRYLSRGDPE